MFVWRDKPALRDWITFHTGAPLTTAERASFAIGDEGAAKRVVDLLTESFFEGQAAIADALAAGGSFLMPAGDYGFSRRFAWLNDEFGVSWNQALETGGVVVGTKKPFQEITSKPAMKAASVSAGVGMPTPGGSFQAHGARTAPCSTTLPA